MGVEVAGRTPIRFELREVLADAYPKGHRGPFLRHTVAIFDDGTAAPICTRVRAENLADAGSLTPAEREGLPTCPSCRAALRRLTRQALED